MYKHSLGYIESKPTDFKICKKCNTLNWYENIECITHYCGSKEFDNSEDEVLAWVEEEYRYWKEDGFNKLVIDEMTVDT